VPRITRDDVLHVAALARLTLTDDEVDRFTAQFEAILEHVASIEALDTAGVAPTAHPVPIENVWREDEPRPSLDQATALSTAPEAEAGRFRVPPTGTSG
jgi:aspartyl-tRNA(Asn)/glutamyl-tRNA(Gln) amidotransferase subunit C